MAEVRLRRLESLLREEISSMIFTSKIKDPRIERLTTVTDVSISKDLANAKVFVSFYGEEAELHASVGALNHASGYIQRVLAERIRIRKMPRLSFIADTSIARGARINKLLRDIAT